MSKSLDPNIQPEKQKPLKGNEVWQDKLCTGQGRAGMRRSSRPPPINQAITQTSELSRKIPDLSKIEMRITNQAHSIASAQSITNSKDESKTFPSIQLIDPYPNQ